MVEPSPFTYVSGYANRFQELLSFLSRNNDVVEIITCDVRSEDPLPSSWNEFRVTHTFGIGAPLYPNVTISVDWTFKALRVIRRLKPDLLHVSSP